jgi:2,4-dienoyl-CoA reductase-like NADH-dependent reductase (Old Yellow Enzyme family)
MVVSNRYPHLFQLIKVGNTDLKNRIVPFPMTSGPITYNDLSPQKSGLAIMGGTTLNFDN